MIYYMIGTAYFFAEHVIFKTETCISHLTFLNTIHRCGTISPKYSAPRGLKFKWELQQITTQVEYTPRRITSPNHQAEEKNCITQVKRKTS